MNNKILIAAVALLLTVPAVAQYPGSRYEPIVDGTSVTFHLKADSAREVRVYGDFLPGVNEYNLGGNVAMERGEKGEWTWTVRDLAPDFYFYYFEVDGVRVLDPHNLHLVCNYSEYFNSFLISGEGSRNLTFADVPSGTFVSHWYMSPQYGGRRHLNVWVPDGYDPSKTYPVLYMIPGGGDDEDTWVDMGRLPQIAAHQIAAGEAVPMVIVLLNAMPNQWAGPHILNPIPGAKSHFELMRTPQGASGGEFVNDLVNNIIPFVETHYSVRMDQSGRAVCGVSMGGVYEMYILEHYPSLFGGIAFMGSGIMGGSPDAADAQLAPLKKTGYDLFWIGAGNKDMALRSAQGLMQALDRAKMPYTYYDSGDGHNWRSWRRNLQQLLPLLFR